MPGIIDINTSFNIENIISPGASTEHGSSTIVSSSSDSWNC